MRWLSFLLVASTAAAAPAQAPPPRAAKPLRFDFTLAPELRDSFVFHVHGEERGWAVWQYEIRSDETGQQLLYTAASELRPVEAESLRIVVNRLTGAPVATFHRLDFFSPGSDTVQLEHDLDVRRGAVTGRRRARTRKGEVRLTPVNTSLPAGVVWSDYQFFAAPLALALPGDSLVGRGYSEFADSVQVLVLVAETPTTVIVPAGSYDVLPLRAGGFRLYVTRTAPRRVVKGETLDGVFTFELAGTERPSRAGS